MKILLIVPKRQTDVKHIKQGDMFVSVLEPDDIDEATRGIEYDDCLIYSDLRISFCDRNTLLRRCTRITIAGTAIDRDGYVEIEKEPVS